MSPYCSAHDEWLIMKLCMFVGYHDSNNVSNLCGDPVTKLKIYIYDVSRDRRSITVARAPFLWVLLRDHAHAAGVWKTVAVNLYNEKFNLSFCVPKYAQCWI